VIATRVPLGFCGGVLALAALAVLSTHYVDYCINLSRSLPGTLYLVVKGGGFAQGDLVAFRWHGGANYPPGTTFIKRVVGVPGDRVRRIARSVWVNDRYIGKAKPTSRAGVPLEPAAEGVIASGEYFVATGNPDSLDSRYALAGNVKQAEIIGRAYAIF